jgi:hypothetical protein
MAYSPTAIANLWVPDLWIQAAREGFERFPSLFTSGAVARTDYAQTIASGPGASANMPFFKDISDTTTDEIQAESVDVNVQNLAAEKMVVPILNRQFALGATALSAQVPGSTPDPVAEIGNIIGTIRAKRRNATALAILRGFFGSYGAAGGPGALSAMRVDAFIEDGNNAGSSNLITVSRFIDATAMLGELAGLLTNGVMLVHPVILASLKKQDVTAFESASRGPFTIQTYRGIPIVESDLLARAGTTSGYVYETYLLSNGVIAYGEKPQLGDVIDVASLQLWQDRMKNNAIVIDRTRFVLHPLGAKWTGTPAGQSATNAELQTVTNWQLVLSSARRAGMVCLRTNG